MVRPRALSLFMILVTVISSLQAATAPIGADDTQGGDPGSQSGPGTGPVHDFTIGWSEPILLTPDTPYDRSSATPFLFLDAEGKEHLVYTNDVYDIVYTVLDKNRTISSRPITIANSAVLMYGRPVAALAPNGLVHFSYPCYNVSDPYYPHQFCHATYDPLVKTSSIDQNIGGQRMVIDKDGNIFTLTWNYYENGNLTLRKYSGSPISLGWELVLRTDFLSYNSADLILGINDMLYVIGAWDSGTVSLMRVTREGILDKQESVGTHTSATGAMMGPDGNIYIVTNPWGGTWLRSFIKVSQDLVLLVGPKEIETEGGEIGAWGGYRPSYFAIAGPNPDGVIAIMESGNNGQGSCCEMPTYYHSLFIDTNGTALQKDIEMERKCPGTDPFLVMNGVGTFLYLNDIRMCSNYGGGSPNYDQTDLFLRYSNETTRWTTDLALYPDDLSHNASLEPGAELYVFAMLRNVGDMTSGKVLITLYDINNSARLTNQSIDYVSKGDIIPLFFNVTVNESTVLKLYAQLLDETDSDPSNNEVAFRVNVTRPSDLSIDERDVSFEPSDLKAGETAVVKTIVRNLGDVPSRATINIFDSARNLQILKKDIEVGRDDYCLVIAEWPDLVPGSQTIDIILTDVFPEESDDKLWNNRVTARLDVVPNLPPVLIISYPFDGQHVTGEVDIQGEVEDPEGANVILMLYIDDISQPVVPNMKEDGVFSFPFNFTGFKTSTHRITVEADDGLLSNSKTIMVVVDSKVPNARIMSHYPDSAPVSVEQYLTQDFQIKAWNNMDEQFVFSWVMDGIEMDGETATNMTFRPDDHTSIGEHMLTVVATVSFTTLEWKWTVIVKEGDRPTEWHSPAFDWLSPDTMDLSLGCGDKGTLMAVVTDEGNDIVEVGVQVDGTTVYSREMDGPSGLEVLEWEVTDSEMVGSEHLIRFYARDRDHNESVVFHASSLPDDICQGGQPGDEQDEWSTGTASSMEGTIGWLILGILVLAFIAAGLAIVGSMKGRKGIKDGKDGELGKRPKVIPPPLDPPSQTTRPSTPPSPPPPSPPPSSLPPLPPPPTPLPKTSPSPTEPGMAPASRTGPSGEPTKVGLSTKKEEIPDGFEEIAEE